MENTAPDLTDLLHGQPAPLVTVSLSIRVPAEHASGLLSRFATTAQAALTEGGEEYGPLPYAHVSLTAYADQGEDDEE